ncbi:MAG: hypothetical protein EZS28_007141 [Streblomastix strix]|uniref:C2 domain-containing protein n=1 Tax=Streblomastix strix TaxID=222440 RepID=A0A5J4WRY5_9EUKA|nr:MAG: hypothetical protein EZS28_007141 [Streblomastix strix]
MSHPPFSPDIAPSDYFLFRSLETMLKWTNCSDETELIAAVSTIPSRISQAELYKAINSWIDHLEVVVATGDMYLLMSQNLLKSDTKLQHIYSKISSSDSFQMSRKIRPMDIFSNLQLQIYEEEDLGYVNRVVKFNNISVRNLKKIDSFGKSDPFVTFKAVDEKREIC